MKRYIVGALIFVLVGVSNGQPVIRIGSTACLMEKQRAEFSLRLTSLTSQILESEELLRRREIYRAKLQAWDASVSAVLKCASGSPAQGSRQCQNESAQLEQAASEKHAAEAEISSAGAGVDELLMRRLVALRAEYPQCPE